MRFFFATALLPTGVALAQDAAIQSGRVIDAMSGEPDSGAHPEATAEAK